MQDTSKRLLSRAIFSAASISNTRTRSQNNKYDFSIENASQKSKPDNGN
jgi:hypothetical protein